MTNLILNEYIQNQLIRRKWNVLSPEDTPEGYDVAVTKKHLERGAKEDEPSYYTTLLIQKRSDYYSCVKFQIHKPNNELFSETEDLAIDTIDERIVSVAIELFKKNTRTLQKEGILPKTFGRFL